MTDAQQSPEDIRRDILNIRQALFDIAGIGSTTFSDRRLRPWWVRRFHAGLTSPLGSDASYHRRLTQSVSPSATRSSQRTDDGWDSAYEAGYNDDQDDQDEQGDQDDQYDYEDANSHGDVDGGDKQANTGVDGDGDGDGDCDGDRDGDNAPPDSDANPEASRFAYT